MSGRVFAIATFFIVLIALVFFAYPEKQRMTRFQGEVGDDLRVVKDGVTGLRSEIDTLSVRVKRVEDAVFAK